MGIKTRCDNRGIKMCYDKDQLEALSQFEAEQEALKQEKWEL